jgi:hypothetical protein
MYGKYLAKYTGPSCSNPAVQYGDKCDLACARCKMALVLCQRILGNLRAKCVHVSGTGISFAESCGAWVTGIACDNAGIRSCIWAGNVIGDLPNGPLAIEETTKQALTRAS